VGGDLHDPFSLSNPQNKDGVFFPVYRAEGSCPLRIDGVQRPGGAGVADVKKLPKVYKKLQKNA
jgi:hypothetical protein